MTDIVFSYDCEGNWGFVDQARTVLDARQSKPLEEAYRFLLDLHQFRGTPATFAFVGLYALTSGARADYVTEHAGRLAGRARYLTRSGGCWEGAANFAQVHKRAQGSDLIEIGSHSLTHVPFSLLDKEDQLDEFRASKQVLAGLCGSDPKTFIFPRNQMGSQTECLQYYRTYRDTPSPEGRRIAATLLSLLTGLSSSAANRNTEQVYWRGGSWKRFPDTGWRRLWRKRMQIARARPDRARTFHVWTHPHNLVTDPGQKDRMIWLFDLLDANKDIIRFRKLSETNGQTSKRPATS